MRRALPATGESAVAAVALSAAVEREVGAREGSWQGTKSHSTGFGPSVEPVTARKACTSRRGVKGWV
jgi:hypothetical protein